MIVMGNKTNYIRHVYHMVDNRYKTYNLYKLYSVFNGEKVLTDIIRIERKSQYNSGFYDWIILKDHSNWNRCTRLTELWPTSIKSVFKGNKKIKVRGTYKPSSLIIAQFSRKQKKLIVDHFDNHYPSDLNLLKVIIQKHSYYLK